MRKRDTCPTRRAPNGVQRKRVTCKSFVGFSVTQRLEFSNGYLLCSTPEYTRTKTRGPRWASCCTCVRRTICYK